MKTIQFAAIMLLTMFQPAEAESTSTNLGRVEMLGFGIVSIGTYQSEDGKMLITFHATDKHSINRVGAFMSPEKAAQLRALLDQAIERKQAFDAK